MSRKIAGYGEARKAEARTLLLSHAIEALTTERADSPLVTASEFDRLLEYSLAYIKKYTRQDLVERFAPIRDDWQMSHQSRVGNRSASDLKILILSGPEPLNDLEKLASLGVSPHNIWAVEGDRDSFRVARDQLREFGFPLKLHFGHLKDFFAVVPEQFDVVYFDACAPLFGGKPRTDEVLRELFFNQRMSPLSALITNFASTPRDNEEKWQGRLFSWYAAQFNQPVDHDCTEIERVADESDFKNHVHEHLEEYYSDFVTRFTIEFSSQLLAWWRVLALRAARRMYFSSDTELESAINAAFHVSDAKTVKEILRSTGHVQLSPSSYWHLWMTRLVEKKLGPTDPFREFVRKTTHSGVALSEAIEAISLVRNFFEGYVDWGKHNWKACSDELREVLDRFRWFDSDGQPWNRMFCDSPLPNLIVDLLTGVYGYPYHVNLRKLRRIEYCAKQTTMLSDVFILDQARYHYDLVPTLPLFGHELPFGLQLTLRICMDLIRRHTHYSCGDLYRGSALAAQGEEGFGIYPWPDRQKLI